MSLNCKFHREFTKKIMKFQAIETGLEIDKPGFNIFVTGAPGSGRTFVVKELIKQRLKNVCGIFTFN